MVERFMVLPSEGERTSREGSTDTLGRKPYARAAADAKTARFPGFSWSETASGLPGIGAKRLSGQEGRCELPSRFATACPTGKRPLKRRKTADLGSIYQASISCVGLRKTTYS